MSESWQFGPQGCVEFHYLDWGSLHMLTTPARLFPWIKFANSIGMKITLLLPQQLQKVTRTFTLVVSVSGYLPWLFLFLARVAQLKPTVDRKRKEVYPFLVCLFRGLPKLLNLAFNSGVHCTLYPILGREPGCYTCNFPILISEVCGPQNKLEQS